jgi:hypothetical protein
MNLELKGDPIGPNKTRLIQQCFAYAEDRLGLSDVKGKVIVEIKDASTGKIWCKGCKTWHPVKTTEFQVRNGRFGLAETTKGGGTDGVIKPGNVAEMLLIDHDNISLLLESMIHELTHIRDVIAGRLQVNVDGSNGTLWQGKFYNKSYLGGSKYGDFEKYENTPWEIIARKSAETILKEFRDVKIAERQRHEKVAA